MEKRLAKFLIVVFAVFFLLFHFPIITIANVSIFFNGIPVFFIYLFATWGLLVLTIFLVVNKTKKENGD